MEKDFTYDDWMLGYHICKNCGKPFQCMRRTSNASYDGVYCDMCCDEYIIRTYKIPKALAPLQRIIIAAKREMKGTRLNWHDKQVLKQIKKYHESRRITQ